MKSTVINLSLSFAIVVTGLAVLVTPALAQGPVIVRISVSENGTQSNNDSHDATISADGRYVAFSSFANNLVVGDTGHRDIFVHDRQTGQLERVSVTSDGGQANNNSFEPMISANGQFVVFASEASNLVPDDSGSNNPNQPATGFTDVFVYDRVNATIERVSIDSDGNAGNDDSFRPAISADGRFVVFRSAADNLVVNDTNTTTDIFVYDRQTGIIKRVSVSSSGTQANDGSDMPTISANGRYVAFHSRADNLVANDTNDDIDVFVHDHQTGQTTRVSVASDGTEGNHDSREPAFSADGNLVAFASDASNLVSGDNAGHRDIFVHNQQTGETIRVSVASDGTESNEWSYEPALSANGQFVAFRSRANNLVANDTNSAHDVFVHNLALMETVRVSVAFNGDEANNWSYKPALSADGELVVFHSRASNLVASDTNVKRDIFVYGSGGATAGTDLSIAKSAPALLPPGETTLPYTLTITAAFSEATNVTLTDTLPAGLTVSGIVTDSGWTCFTANGSVTCSRDSLPTNITSQLLITTTVTTQTGFIENKVEIASDTPDLGLVNNRDSAFTAIQNSCVYPDYGTDIVIEAEAFNSIVARNGRNWTVYDNAIPGASDGIAVQALPRDGFNAGENKDGPTLHYNLYLTQPGPYYVYLRGASADNDNSVHLSVDDGPILTGGDIGLSMTPFGEFIWTDAAPDGTAPDFVIDTPGLHTLDIWARETGVIVDKIVVSREQTRPTDTGPGVTPCVPQSEVSLIEADLSITTASINPSFTAGNTITYTLSISNAGPTVAISTSVVNYWTPAGAVIAANAPAGCTVDVAAGTVTCDVNDVRTDSLAPTLDIGLVTSVYFSGTLTQTASLSTPLSVSDFVTTNNTSPPVPVTVAPVPYDWTLTKAVVTPTVISGDRITFTLAFSYSISGTQVITPAALVSDALHPVALTEVISQGSPNMTMRPIPGSGYSWAISNLAALDTGVITLSGVIQTVETLYITNTATITATYDLTATNNAASITATVKPLQPPLTLNKTALPRFSVQPTEITYNLVVANPGPVTATNLIIDDIVPTGATYLSGGNLIGDNQDTVVWLVPSLGGGQSITASFVVTASQTITNRQYQVRADDNLRTNGRTPIITYIGPNAPPRIIASTRAPQQVQAGELITYLLTITNEGLAPALSLNVAHALRDVVYHVEGGTMIDGMVYWDVDQIPGQSSVTLMLVVTASRTITGASYRITGDDNLTIDATQPVTTWVTNSASLVLLTPVNNAIVRNAQPAFQWQLIDTGFSTSHYRLEVSSDITATILVTTTQTSYTITDHLPTGTYTWTVHAMSTDGQSHITAEPAQFIIEPRAGIYIPFVVKAD